MNVAFIHSPRGHNIAGIFRPPSVLSTSRWCSAFPFVPALLRFTSQKVRVMLGIPRENASKKPPDSAAGSGAALLVFHQGVIGVVEPGERGVAGPPRRHRKRGRPKKQAG